MKIELEDAGVCVKKISIEVPKDKVEEERKAVFAEMARQAHIPGFRKGKVPHKILEKRFGPSALGDAADRLIRGAYREALEKNNLNPVGDPIIENVHFHEGSPLSFSATVEVLPEVELKDYEGTVLKKKVAQVSEDEVTRALDRYRENMARLEPVLDRPAAEGDFVIMDYRASREGKEVAPLTGQGKQVHLVKDDMLEGVYSGIVGMNKGEEKTFTATLPKEFPDPELAGAQLEFYAKVNEIKAKILPALDDNLAKDVSEFDTLDGLKDSIRRGIIRRNESMAENALREEVVSHLIKENPFGLPPRMVERRTSAIAERTEKRFRDSGVAMDGSHYNRDAFMPRFQESAEREIREEIVLASAARKEKVEVTEADINHEIGELARILGQPEDMLKARLAQGDGLIGLYQKAVFDKAYQAVLGKMKIEEEQVEGTEKK